MKIYSFILILAAACTFTFAQTKLGKEITVTEKTDIAAIVENPEEFVGKKVLIEGKVEDVCPMAGCWMKMSENGKDIKIKVKDGVIVFPMEAIGSTAMVEGEVYKIELSQEDAIDYYQHLAEEKNEQFDSTTVTGPVVLYQVKGMAAVINAQDTKTEVEVIKFREKTN